MWKKQLVKAVSNIGKTVTGERNQENGQNLLRTQERYLENGEDSVTVLLRN